MSITNYKKPPRAIRSEYDCLMDEVARPWLEAGKTALDWKEVECVCLICHRPAMLACDGFRDYAQQFSDLLRDHPADVGTLIAKAGKWLVKQRKTKCGRIRHVIEITRNRYPEKALNYGLIKKVAKEEKIEIEEVSVKMGQERMKERKANTTYVENRVNEMAHEWEAFEASLETPEARAAADASVDATLAARGERLTGEGRAKRDAHRTEYDACRAEPAKRSKMREKMNA